MNKSLVPTDVDLRRVLGGKYSLWMEIRNRVINQYPEGKEEWNFPGKKYGWSFWFAVPDRAALEDIFHLIDFKLAF